jgi:hypothetical protein
VRALGVADRLDKGGQQLLDVPVEHHAPTVRAAVLGVHLVPHGGVTVEGVHGDHAAGLGVDQHPRVVVVDCQGQGADGRRHLRVGNADLGVAEQHRRQVKGGGRAGPGGGHEHHRAVGSTPRDAAAYTVIG